MRMRVAQCLCSKRHCIFGFALHDPETPDQDVMQMLKEAIWALVHGRGELLGGDAPQKINPYCGICGEKTQQWVYEVCWSKEFASWEEAQEVMRQLEKANQRTHELLNMLGFSYDSKMWRKRAESN